MDQQDPIPRKATKSRPLSSRSRGAGSPTALIDLSMLRTLKGDDSSAEGMAHYNLVVIGGGSGGLACAKEAAVLGKKVMVLDYVEPSPKGTKWGLGGTCVNVGCIPKKLMHQAAILGGALKDAKKFGWNVPDNVSFSWEALSSAVQSHVRSLNFGHRVQLREKRVDYLNAKGVLRDKNTVVTTDSTGNSTVVTTDNIVIATGTRPKYPSDIPGAMEHGISSDDIFWQRTAPGKTLCIGASYVALETAGFLNGLGYDTTVMVRSVPLSRFDVQMAAHVVADMTARGTRFLTGCGQITIEKVSGSKFKVSWMRNDEELPGGSEIFDTVLIAIGRRTATEGLGLKEAGVSLDCEGFIIGGHGNDAERSSVPNIYAIGDTLQKCQQLTPVAIKSGKMLARRLFGSASQQMDYLSIPTTLFTPLEYSFVGETEESARNKYGESSIAVYHAYFKPLEYTVAEKNAEHCYIKVIMKKSGSCDILGIHYTGPNAGEVMQGFAVALRCGLTRDKLLTTIGIHPTCAEEIVKLYITKESGTDPHVTGC